MTSARHSSALTLLRSLGLAAVLAVLAAGLAAGPAEAKTKITNRTFGIHSFTTQPGVPAGTIRLSCAPLWRITEPSNGKYQWARMDQIVTRAEQWGFTDIQFVFCGTPKWAASGPVKRPQDEKVFGPGSTAAPKRLSDWRDFATRVVQRYGSRIDTYQTWNEITSPQFYQGSISRMVAMTKILKTVVDRYAPRSRVAAASVQTHVPDWFKNRAIPYFKGLRKAKWPVHVVAGHFYPPGKGGPNQRMNQIEMFQKALRKQKLPRNRQQWDTEGNFWTSVSGNPRAGRVRGTKAATYVARNYLDTWRLGLRRSYWYLWSATYVPFAGVQLRSGDAGTRAYRTLGAWTIGSTMKSCKDRGKLVTCTFKRKGAAKFTVAFTEKGKAKYRYSGRKRVCPVTGAKCRSVKKKVTVTTLPVRIA